MFAFPGSYQWCCRSCLSPRLSEISLAHIHERSSVGICLLCVRLVMLLCNFQMILLLCCFSMSCLRGNLHLLVHCWPQSGTAGGYFELLSNFPLYFGLLRALSRPISCCFLSVLLPVLARVHLLVMSLHCMLQYSVALPLCGGSSWPIYSKYTSVIAYYYRCRENIIKAATFLRRGYRLKISGISFVYKTKLTDCD